jgi:hypothetical protein
MLILPVQITKARRQGQRDHNQNEFPRAAAFWLLVVFQQIIEIARARPRLRIDAQRVRAPRRRLIQSQKRGPADDGLCRGRCLNPLRRSGG